MKWIVVAIIACIVPYTWISFHFRKAGPAHLPYEDNKERAQVLRLIDAGFRRTPLTVSHLENAAAVAPTGPLATAEPIAGGLPRSLDEILIDRPSLPASIDHVAAASTANLAQPYLVQFMFTQSGEPQRITTATVYLRDLEVVIVPQLASLANPPARPAAPPLTQLELPASLFASGTYQFTLVGAESSRSWSATFP